MLDNDQFNDMLFHCAEKAFNTSNNKEKAFDNSKFNKQLADNIRETMSNDQNYCSVFIFNDKIHLKSIQNNKH